MTKVLTALIAGHRTDRLAQKNVGTPSFDQLRTVIQSLKVACQSNEAGLRVLTGASDGTDAEAAEIAAENNLPLHLLAPGLPSSLTLSPAQQRAERQVWLGAEKDDFASDEPYSVRDQIALGFADLLIVVWDGEAARGMTGGTVRLVFQAALAMKPVVWITTAGAIRLLDRTQLSAHRRHRLECPDPRIAWLTACFSETSVNQALGARLYGMVSPALKDPGFAEGGAGGSVATRAGHFHRAMMNLAQGNVSAALSAFRSQDVRADRGPAWNDKANLMAPTPVLDAHFDQADVDATIAAGRHRDATWIIYASATVAVFCAVAGAIYLWPGGRGPLWAIIELLLVVGVVTMFNIALNEKWHSDWVGQRFIAEQLRYVRMGLPLLALPRSVHQSAWMVSVNRQGVAQEMESEELRAIQHTVVASGLPSAPDSSIYVASTRASFAALRDYIQRVVNEQIEYHHKKHHREHAVHRLLHKLSMGLFGLTGAAVLAHFFITGTWLLVFTAFCPALAAGIHGLATKLEIARLATQSAVTELELKQLGTAIANIDASEGSAWQQWLQLRHLALAAARVMSDENGQWHKLVSHQEPELPA
jgi:hypothetical protein